MSGIYCNRCGKLTADGLCYSCSQPKAAYILIDAETRRPVPLPFYTIWSYEDMQGHQERPVTIINFDHEKCFTHNGGWFVPQALDLAIITEADFMAEQGGNND